MASRFTDWAAQMCEVEVAITIAPSAHRALELTVTRATNHPDPPVNARRIDPSARCMAVEIDLTGATFGKINLKRLLLHDMAPRHTDRERGTFVSVSCVLVLELDVPHTRWRRRGVRA